MELSFSVLVAAVFCGNVLTAIFIWGAGRIGRAKDGEETNLSYYVLAAFLMPLAVFVLTLIGAGSHLPFLGVLASQ
jgi:hypothetical protein